jgi:multiple sugar transport system substrate-binding protein
MWQEALLYSSGSTVINKTSSGYANNINDPMLKKSGTLMGKIASRELFLKDDIWRDSFPKDNSVLFLAMGAWSVPKSTADNPKSDIFFVPFPRADDANAYYEPVDVTSYMLAAGSTNGDAVAAYLKCERLVNTREEYHALDEQNALTNEGWTKDQYDFLNAIQSDSKVVPVYDYGWGMGKQMYTQGEPLYDKKGIINKLYDGIADGNVESWSDALKEVTKKADTIVGNFNK